MEYICIRRNKYSYEFEQEMSKHIHDLKNELREKECNQRDSPECSWTSLLRSENC